MNGWSGDDPGTLARNDFQEVLKESFGPSPDAETFVITQSILGMDGAAPMDAASTEANVAAVEWSFNAIHTGDFAGVSATQRSVTFRGVTIIDRSKGEELYSRYVDWLYVMAQLGIASTMRPVVDPPK